VHHDSTHTRAACHTHAPPRVPRAIHTHAVRTLAEQDEEERQLALLALGSAGAKKSRTERRAERKGRREAGKAEERAAAAGLLGDEAERQQVVGVVVGEVALVEGWLGWLAGSCHSTCKARPGRWTVGGVGLRRGVAECLGKDESAGCSGFSDTRVRVLVAVLCRARRLSSAPRAASLVRARARATRGWAAPATQGRRKRRVSAGRARAREGGRRGARRLRPRHARSQEPRCRRRRRRRVRAGGRGGLMWVGAWCGSGLWGRESGPAGQAALCLLAEGASVGA
jgi:hypothetical protein